MTRREYVVGQFRLSRATTFGPVAGSNAPKAQFNWYGLLTPSQPDSASADWLITMIDGHPYVEKWTGPITIMIDGGARERGWRPTSKAFSMLAYIALFPHYPDELSPELLKQ